MLKIIERHGDGGNGEGANYQVDIQRDGKHVTGFYAGPLHECPEDASLERDLYYAYEAVNYFKLGYDAGKNGEEVTFEEAPKEE